MMSTKESRSDSLTARHCMNELPMLSDDTNVWISSQGEPVQGRVVSSADTLRSYVIDTTSGQLCRNRHHLTSLPGPSPVTQPPQTAEQPEPPR